MAGTMRNLFGTYKLYDTPDYEDLVPKFLFAEKWCLYASGCLAVYDYTIQTKPPKGFVAVSRHVLKFVLPVAVAGGTFVAALYSSAHLRGKKDDEWNSCFATVASGAIFHKMVRGPWTFLNYFFLVGLTTNLIKQAVLNDFDPWNTGAQEKAREEGYLLGPYITNFTYWDPKDYPPKWINGDELDAKNNK